MYAEIVPDQKLGTWQGCHRRALEWFGGVPLKMIIDNTKCAITRACYYDPEVQRSYGDLAEGYGFLIASCPPRDPLIPVEVKTRYFGPLLKLTSTWMAPPATKFP
jgi:transposase